MRLLGPSVLPHGPTLSWEALHGRSYALVSGFWRMAVFTHSGPHESDSTHCCSLRALSMYLLTIDMYEQRQGRNSDNGFEKHGVRKQC